MLRNSSIDYLKLALACMVVGLHTNFFQDVSHISSVILSDGFFRVAVPTFLLINGFYYQESKTREQKLTWLKRVGILYFFWTLAYSPIWLSDPTSSLSLVTKITKNVVIGYHHLWYLPAMILSVAMVHLTRKWSTAMKLAFFAVLYCTGVLLQYFSSFHVWEDTALGSALHSVWIHRNFLFFACPFFVLGMVINASQWHLKISQSQCLALLALGALGLAAEAYVDLVVFHAYSGLDNLATLVVICPALFIFVLQHETHHRDTRRLSLLSSGIYFIHPALQLFWQHKFQLAQSALTLAVLGSSLFGAAVLVLLKRRLPFIL